MRTEFFFTHEITMLAISKQKQFGTSLFLLSFSQICFSSTNRHNLMPAYQIPVMFTLAISKPYQIGI